MKNSNKLSYTLICILAVVFLISSITKMVNIHSFAMEVGEYIDLYMPSWLHGMQMSCAIGVCIAEFTLGLIGLRREYMAVAGLGIFAMLTFFVCLTAQNVFFPTMFGSVESCGCFGELIHFSPLASFIKSLVMWIISLVAIVMVLIHLIKKTEHLRLSWMFKDIYFYFSVVAGVLLIMSSYFYVNEMEHVTYVCLYSVICLLIAISVYLLFRRNVKKVC